MITGIIEDGLHPRVQLELAGAKSSENILMLVDTGFDLDVGLHFDFADRLGLEIYDFALFEYANGQSSEDLLCRARINWHGQWQDVDIVLTDDEEAALGTRLLEGCIMTMDFVHDTMVIEKPLP
jgi:predicted aspartyl protease